MDVMSIPKISTSKKQSIIELGVFFSTYNFSISLTPTDICEVF